MTAPDLDIHLLAGGGRWPAMVSDVHDISFGLLVVILTVKAKAAPAGARPAAKDANPIVVAARPEVASLNTLAGHDGHWRRHPLSFGLLIRVYTIG